MLFEKRNRYTRTNKCNAYKKYQFIIGKLFPFWVLGLVILTVGLTIAKVVFSIPILGNIGLIYFFTSIYLLVILGIGLIISNHSDTQQQAMFIAWFSR